MNWYALNITVCTDNLGQIEFSIDFNYCICTWTRLYLKLMLYVEAIYVFSLEFFVCFP